MSKRVGMPGYLTRPILLVVTKMIKSARRSTTNNARSKKQRMGPNVRSCRVMEGGG